MAHVGQEFTFGASSRFCQLLGSLQFTRTAAYENDKFPLPGAHLADAQKINADGREHQNDCAQRVKPGGLIETGS